MSHLGKVLGALAGRSVLLTIGLGGSVSTWLQLSRTRLDVTKTGSLLAQCTLGILGCSSIV